MSDSIGISELRRRIIKKGGLVPPIKPDKDAHYPPPIPYDESMVDFAKTPAMKYIETKYHILLRLDIFNGSLNDIVKRYGYEIDRATASRWRKHIRRFVIKHDQKRKEPA